MFLTLVKCRPKLFLLISQVEVYEVICLLNDWWGFRAPQQSCLSGDDFADYCNVTALTQSGAVILLRCEEKIKLRRNLEVKLK